MSLTGSELMNLVGREVKINRGGPDSVVGVLLGVQSNYLAVLSKEGSIVYVNSTHIKSVSVSGQSSSGERSISVTPIQSYNFAGLLQALRYRYVQVNRGGPEKVEGIVVDANQSYLILALKDQEIARIPIYHIKSITVITKSDSNDNNSNNSNSSNSNNKSNNNKSNNNKSSNNRTNNNMSNNRSRSNQSSNFSGQNQSIRRSGASGRNNRRSGSRSIRRSGRRSNRGSSWR